MKKITKRKINKIEPVSDTEIELTDNIIELLEYDLEENGVLTYNSVPIKLSGKYLIRLSNDNLNFDKENFVPFRPIKNHKHIQFLIDFLYEEKPKYEIKTKKIKNEELNKNFYISTIYCGERIIARSKSLPSEIESKFYVLYVYYFGSEGILDKIREIRHFGKEK